MSSTVARQPPRHVVALGASAGGLEALAVFFQHMPVSSGMCFVVVQHLAPDHKSMMVELLSRHTSMRVVEAADGMALDPNTVYQLPPRKNMILSGGLLRLHDKPHGPTTNLPIDVFLRSLAEELGERGVGIILSGTGSDGTRGARALKEAGGMLIAQDIASAKFDGMPRSVIATGLVDCVLAPEQMGEQLVRFAQHIYQVPEPLDPMTDEESLAALLQAVKRHTGVDFSQYKPATVMRRIARRMNINQQASLADYLRFAYTQPREISTLGKELLIGVTRFFRDPEAFEALEREVIPALIADIAQHDTLRVWVAGCSTGEEAYSLAILLHEHLEAAKRTIELKVFATDIDRDALDIASAGVYPESVAADIAPDRLSRFFVAQPGQYQVARVIRQSVIFAHHNIMRDPPFSRADLISCRNLLIYLEVAQQRKVLSSFHFALKPGRYLFLGQSESLGELADHFKPLDTRHKLYERHGGARLPITQALAPEPLSPFGATPKQLASAGGTQRNDIAQATARAYRDLATRHAPASMLLNERMELIHTIGDLSWCLRIPRGEVSLNVLAMLPKRLASLISLASQKALREDRPTLYQSVMCELDGAMLNLDVTVRPLHERQVDTLFVLVELIRHDRPTAETLAPSTFNLEEEHRWEDMQRELQHARDNLQATIEELETANEELQATNEELLSSNEELQSANEELQSLNEELITINAEYQAKIQELTQLGHDMEHLLRSTHVATLFLDERLTVRSFTPDVSQVINIITRDVGRPIEHLTINAEGLDLVALLREVRDTKVSIERDINVGPDRASLMRILPYLGEGGGVVATFIDITQLKQTQQHLQDVLDSLPEQLVVTDQEGIIVLANRAWARFGMDNQRDGATHTSQFLGESYLEVCDNALGDDARIAQRVGAGLRAVLAGELNHFQIEYPCHSPAQQRWFVMHAAPLQSGQGAVVSHVDITRRARAELRVAQLERDEETL